MSFQNLANVHSRRHAERIEHDVDRGTVFQIGHIFLRYDHRYHALVAVAACHFVARLNATLDGQVNLDHFQHAGGQVVTLHELAALFVELFVEGLALLVEVPSDFFELLVDVVGLHSDFEPELARQTIKIFDRDRFAAPQTAGATVGQAADQHSLHALI